MKHDGKKDMRRKLRAPIVFLLWVGYILFIRIRRPEVFDDWLEFTNSIFQTEEEIDLVKLIPNHEIIAARFRKRRKHLREYCSRNYVSNELRMSDSDWLNIIADDSLPSPRTKRKSKFFGCIPPESGSTIFQAWWWDVYNPNLDFTRDSRKENQRKMDQMKLKSKHKLLESESTIRFLVVRHPLTRFIASWDDIFCSHCTNGKDIINRNAQLKSLNTEDGTSDYLISFPDLVNYANQRNLNFDVHFASQMSQCHPCAINYDYIIKLETIYEDIQYLMAILNRPDNTKELISQETISKNKNGELFKFYFNLLSPEALETLNRIHLDDLDIFNYSFDPIKKLIGGWD